MLSIITDIVTVKIKLRLGIFTWVTLMIEIIKNKLSNNVLMQLILWAKLKSLAKTDLCGFLQISSKIS